MPIVKTFFIFLLCASLPAFADTIQGFAHKAGEANPIGNKKFIFTKLNQDPAVLPQTKQGLYLNLHSIGSSGPINEDVSSSGMGLSYMREIKTSQAVELTFLTRHFNSTVGALGMEIESRDLVAQWQYYWPELDNFRLGIGAGLSHEITRNRVNDSNAQGSRWIGFLSAGLRMYVSYKKLFGLPGDWTESYFAGLGLGLRLYPDSDFQSALDNQVILLGRTF